MNNIADNIAHYLLSTTERKVGPDVGCWRSSTVYRGSFGPIVLGISLLLYLAVFWFPQMKAEHYAFMDVEAAKELVTTEPPKEIHWFSKLWMNPRTSSGTYAVVLPGVEHQEPGNCVWSLECALPPIEDI